MGREKEGRKWRRWNVLERGRERGNEGGKGEGDGQRAHRGT